MPRPDEGLIHAWLDGQLPPEDAARVEQLAAADPEWGAAVAEARGLIAASSRILSSLDHAPVGVIPERKTPQPAWRMPWWTKVAAAVVVVAGGSLLVFGRADVPEMATAPSAKSAVTVGVASQANAPVTVQAPATATPNGKKSPPSPASTARQVAAAKMANKENPAAPPAPATSLTAELRPKAEIAARAVPAMPQSLLSKDVATNAAEPAGADAQVARRVSGGAAAPANIQARGIRCYRVRDPKALTDAGVIMQMMNADGDTLRLEPVQGQSGLRAWIVWRDGLGHGAMTAADGTGAVAIIATVSTCPAP